MAIKLFEESFSRGPVNIDPFFERRENVKIYGLIPNFALRILSSKALYSMYEKTMEQAVEDYGVPLMGGVFGDFEDIALVTLSLEREVIRRGLIKKRLNPRENAPPVYASDVWACLKSRRNNRPKLCLG